MIFELGYDVFVKEEGGYGGVLVAEMLVETCVLEVSPNIVVHLALNWFKYYRAKHQKMSKIHHFKVNLSVNIGS